MVESMPVEELSGGRVSVNGSVQAGDDRSWWAGGFKSWIVELACEISGLRRRR